MYKIKRLALLPFLAFATASAQENPKDYRVPLETVRAKYNLPSLTGIAVVGNHVQGVGVTGQLAGTYVGGKAATLDAKYQLGSLTKSLTATMIARLVEQGKLGWDSKLGDVLKDVPMRDEYRSVTLLELLTHRSGLVRDVPIPLGNQPYDEMKKQFLAVALAKPRGPKAFSYSNMNYVAAAMIAEKAAGKDWQTLMREEVFTPLGMNGCDFGFGQDGVDPVPHRFLSATEVRDYKVGLSPVYEGADQIRCTMTAMAPYLLAHLNGEKGSTYLRPETWKFLHTDPFGSEYALGWGLADRKWGNGLVLTHSGSDGYNYAVIWLAPARGIGAMVASNIGFDEKKTDARIKKPADEAVGLLLSDALKAKP